MNPRPFAPVLLPIVAVLVAGCAALEDELARRWPTASVESARVAGLDFEAARLALDVRIDNPNPLAVELDGLDYTLRLDGRRVLSGDRGERLEVPADGSGRVAIPLRIPYREVRAVLGGLAERDSVRYAVDLGLQVDVPVLGKRRLPLEASGSLPVPSVPEVRVLGLRVEGLDWSGARAVLDLAVRNPNGFGLALDRLRYGLRVDGDQWASGAEPDTTRIPAGGEGRIALPLVLDFEAIGRSAYRALAGDDPLDYTLEGTLSGVAGNELMGGFDWSFDRSGRLPVAR